MICVATGAGKALVFAASAFTLAWTHSVERTRWIERWQVGPAGLTVAEARIEGSGAGMEPPDGASLEDGVYVYRPKMAPLQRLTLAASGATGAGWRFCVDGGACVELGRASGPPVVIDNCLESGKEPTR